MNLSLDYWPIDRCVDYSRNPRKNDTVIHKMVASITEFGFTIPILVKSDGLVIDGHLRLKAARQLKMDQVPVVIADHLSDVQIKAFRLLANRSANWAEWDDELLKLELDDLKSFDFDLTLTGFDDHELTYNNQSIFEPESSTQEIDPDGYELDHRCPRCGFEFNDNK